MTRRWEVHVSTLPISLVSGREDSGRSTENENGCRPRSAPVTSLPHPGIPHHESVVTVRRLRHRIGCGDQAGIAHPGVIRDLGQTSRVSRYGSIGKPKSGFQRPPTKHSRLHDSFNSGSWLCCQPIPARLSTAAPQTKRSLPQSEHLKKH